MDRLDFDLDLKLAADDDGSSGSVEGYASVFGLTDRGGDIVMPGAFKASIADWKRRKAAPPILWQHDPRSPIGIWSELAEDDRGLKVKGDLILDVPQAMVARSLLRAGAVKGLSIGYLTKEAETDRQTGARRLKKVELWEISLVTFPMLPEAQVTGVKGDFNPTTWERAFRDEGLSNREAKLATSVARKLVLRDGGPNPHHAPRDGAVDVLMALRRNAARIRS